MHTHKEMNECLTCGGTNLQEFCDLGVQPLANNLKGSRMEAEELFPLKTNVCLDCWHSQLSIAVDKELLYKHYLYVSGTSTTLKKEFDNIVRMIASENTGSTKKVLDIACNDGTFLKSFRDQGWEVRGIDPAENIVESTDKDLNIICDFFPSNKLNEKFNAITCFNVVAHIPNVLDFIKSAGDLLTEDGTLYIQTSQKDMIKNGEFDTIYHEHHSFFSINSMKTVCKRAGMVLVDVDFRPVHGTSYLFKIKKGSFQEISQLQSKIDAESYLYNIKTYEQFNQIVQERKSLLLEKIRNSKKKPIGYGVAAKGVVRMNYFGIEHQYAVDDNPLKIGKVIGGVNIPIVSNKHMIQDPDDLMIIVYPWNFYDEIVEKIKLMRPDRDDNIVSSY
jgi:2-polyprenyl-3-methyl-5-hydroxy-6-metoxy-1,4-benzoquinol methylase